MNWTEHQHTCNKYIFPFQCSHFYFNLMTMDISDLYELLTMKCLWDLASPDWVRTPLPPHPKISYSLQATMCLGWVIRQILGYPLPVSRLCDIHYYEHSHSGDFSMRDKSVTAVVADINANEITIKKKSTISASRILKQTAIWYFGFCDYLKPFRCLVSFLLWSKVMPHIHTYSFSRQKIFWVHYPATEFYLTS